MVQQPERGHHLGMTSRSDICRMDSHSGPWNRWNHGYVRWKTPISQMSICKSAERGGFLSTGTSSWDRRATNFRDPPLELQFLGRSKLCRGSGDCAPSSLGYSKLQALDRPSSWQGFKERTTAWESCKSRIWMKLVSASCFGKVDHFAPSPCGIILFATCSQADLCLVNGAEDSAVTRWVGWPPVEVTPNRDLYA